jgi:hypothetical protein
LSFWHTKTSFNSNLTSYLNGIVKKWWVAGALLVMVPYLALGAAWLVEGVSSLALGLASALYQAPARYIWGAAYHRSPDSRFTRFWSGFNQAVAPALEGKGKAAGANLARIFGNSLNQTAPSGRPALKAFLTLIPAGLLTTLFLSSFLFNLSPLWALSAALGWMPAHLGGLSWKLLAALFGGTTLFVGILEGARNARGEKVKVPSYYDVDNPAVFYADRIADAKKAQAAYAAMASAEMQRIKELLGSDFEEAVYDGAGLRVRVAHAEAYAANQAQLPQQIAGVRIDYQVSNGGR